MAMESVETNKESLETALEAMFRGELDALDNVYAEDVEASDPTTTIQGLDAYKAWIQSFLDAFPDIELDLTNLVAEDDIVTTYFTVRGTHEGEFEGIAPTGNSFEQEGVAIDWFEDGKVVREVNIWDNLSFVQQLGLDPSDL